MDDVPPWDTGDYDLNWPGYFIPGSSVLRNRVGATTRETLAGAENDLVEVRVAELRNNPSAVTRTYDLDHLKALHQYLFQDVYLWAGELRTVGIEKENESFMPPGDIGRPVAYIAGQIAETKHLRSISNADLPGCLAEMYDFVNFAHPFREGNGRTQREFFDQLLSESGRGLAWDAIELAELHRACHLARAEQNMEPLRTMFAKIVDDDPAYRFGRDTS
ncbi:MULTISPECIES: Fic family protein [unclassified Rhodococcus (in: high G+C Gram-positive bacteria)]|uniref:Fic/DOC family protein n=1 Tax=unclassified Rhodococcus (in: high G+C Gram-positive bacteria) TaxID=192944 RepID=UPI001446FBB7|nr:MULTISPECIES: Fic family protein [unclassified Rhodococcus (in: high G+C Gram-positive bacteria)]